ncbi:hydrogenase 2 large subunit [Haemophilus haemolyticus]|jgi:hydrogenase 2, large subunit|uniref:hydrogenase 2 large subunit n=1 Tax=Haemophilus TaxID=724 RepID=UPI000DAE6ABA|nr:MULTISPECIES: hydrogenase 2 large subunit [Haemophilus]UJZ89508.1 hydrogenase 2 large subunit [Haemophilus seminalis]MDQ6574548.1 hydrogenase 2 large subunit [Haemophilus haemolyticus]RDE69595.1 hydrogenase 2 large subunit [Haemophilus haemolyticus]TPH06640.1 hydrogenase 2 large subunit [Haemophilus haemolyticus]TPH27362.1 hydrogenase 2 large subunit [Haemophilus haemolyticus]
MTEKKRISIDPITRIEGHLRIDCEIENGVVTNAWSSGTMWRGMENIVKGSDPRDAWMIMQRICGVCTTVHAIMSVRAVEDALGAKVPVNAQYIRNMILSAHSMHDHIVHFYQLSAMDWVDITAALNADPDKAAEMLKGVSTWGLNSANEFRNVQNKIKSLVESGQLGIFANGYFGHPAMKLPPEVNLIAVAHYLQALECQRDCNRIVALLGGKTPHIQNLAIGGVANPINLDSQSVLNLERLMFVKSCIDRLNDFVTQVYRVDAAIIAAYYPEWLNLGKTSGNYLSVPEYPIDGDNSKFALTGGYIENFDISTFRSITQQKDEFVVKGIKESGKHAWYEDDEPLEPWAGLTRPKYTGWQDEGKYSWVKAPSFYGKVVEVGPLAYLMCNLANENKDTLHHFNHIKGLYEKLSGNTLSVDHLHSTLGRIIARTVHCCVLNNILEQQWKLLVDNIGTGDTVAYLKTDIPQTGEFKGVGFGEVPRGMLSHWVVVKNGKIENYQAVVPSTWNAGPRNQNDEMGPYELSIIGTPVADPTKPLEVVRTIHSFDPCMSCAVHVVNTENGEVTHVKVL